MKKNKYFIILIISIISSSIHSQSSEFDIEVKRGDSSIYNKIYNFIKLDSPKCISDNENEKFHIYFKATNYDVNLKIYLDNKYLGSYSIHYDFNFPNLISSIDTDLIAQDSKIEILYEEKKIEFTVDKENKSVLITPSFDVSLVDIKIISIDGDKIKFEENYTKVEDKVVVECFDFDYIYDYIRAFNCFKMTGMKLFHKH